MEDFVLKQGLTATTQTPANTPKEVSVLSKDTGVDYLKLSQEKELADQLAINKRLEAIQKSAPSVTRYYQRQENIDMTISHLDELVKRADFAKGQKKKMAFVPPTPIGEVITTSFRRSLAAIEFGEAVESEDAIAIAESKKILDSIPTHKESGFKGAVGEFASLAGTFANTLPELARNELIWMAGSAVVVAATGGFATPAVVAANVARKVKTGVGFALKASAATKATKVGKVLHNLSQAEAVAESIYKSEVGNAIHEISQANPSMPYTEVRKRAEAAGMVSSLVESFGWAIGIPKLLIPAFRFGIGKLVKEGAIKPTIAASKPFLRRVGKAIAVAGLATASELSEEKVQGLVMDAAKEIEGEIGDTYLALGKSSSMNLMEDALNLANPMAVNSDRNREFFKDMENMRNALFFSSLIGLGIKGIAKKKYSNDEEVKPTEYQQFVENLDMAEKENETLIERLKKAKEVDADGKLSTENPEANRAFNMEIDQDNGRVFMTVDDFNELTERLLEDPEVSDQTLLDIESLQKQAALLGESNEKLEIPYSKYSGIFQPNGELFQDSLDVVSSSTSTLSKKEIRSEQQRLIDTAEEVRELTEDDSVYHMVKASFADDVGVAPTKITDSKTGEVIVGGQFHGTSGEITELQESSYAELNIYGQGFYTTSSYSIAQGYEKKGRGKKPSIYSVSEKTPVRLYNIEDKVSGNQDLLSSIEEASKHDNELAIAFDTAIEFKGEDATVRDIYDELRLSSESADTIQDSMQTVQEVIEDQGFGGITHIGGKFTGKAPHEVKIYFNPRQDLEIKKTSATADGVQPVKKTNLTEREVEDVAVAAQLMINTLSSMRKNPMTPTEFWNEFGVAIDVTKDERGIAEKIRDAVIGEGKLKQDQRGSYDATKRLIQVFKDGDATTLLHEFGGHYFLGELERTISAGEANEQWVSNYEKIREWTGAKEGSLFDLEINREANEKFAQGFERYLAEGKAPTASLKAIFERMADLFMKIYTSLKKAGVPINADMRKVYGQMFAAYEDIRAANKANKNFTIPKPKGVSEEFYQAYIQDEVKGNGRAQRKLIDERVKVSEAMKTKRMKAIIEKATKDAYESLEDSPIHKAQRATIENKLDIESLKEYEIDTSAINKKYKTSKEGSDPALMADSLGFESVHDYVEAITESKEIHEVVNDIVDNTVSVELKKLGLDQLPIKSAINESYFKAMVKKAIMAGGKNPDEARLIEETILEAATERFNESKTKDAIRLDKWREAQQRQSDMAHRSMLQEDKDKSYKAFVAAAHAQIQSMLSGIARKKVKAFNSFQKKYKFTTELRKDLGQGNYNTIVAILNNFGFNKKTNSTESVGELLTTFITTMDNDIGISGAEAINNFRDFLEKGGTINDIPYKDLALLSDILKAMEAMSRKSQKLIIAGKELTEKEALEKITANTVKKLDAESAGTIKGAFSGFFMNILAVKPIFMKMAMGEHFTENYLLPLKAGFDSASDMLLVYRDKVAKVLLDNNIVLTNKKTVKIEGLNKSYTSENLFMFAANIISSEKNREEIYKTIALHNGNKELTDQQRKALHEAIPNEYWEAGQGVIDIFKELFPAASKSYLEINGVDMAFVKGEAFTNPSGKTYDGGYFPSMKASKQFKELKSGEMVNIRKSSTSSNSSFGQERSEGITGDLDMTTGVLMKTLHDVTMDIHATIPYNNLGRLLNKKGRELREFLGDTSYNAIVEWHNKLSVPDYITSRGLAYADSVNKTSTMMLSIPKGLVQMFGFLSAKALIPAEYINPEIAKAIANPFYMIESASKKSLYMRDRYKHIEKIIMGAGENDVSLTEYMKTLDRKQLAKARDAMMYFIKYGDAFSSNIVWNATYNQMIAKGKSESIAVMWADDIVRQTQGDFSSYTRPEAFKGLLRIFSPYVSYFANMGTNFFSLSMTKQNRKLAYLTFIMLVLQPTLEALTKEAFKEDDDDYLERVVGTAVSQAAGAAGLMAFSLGGYGGQIASEVVTGGKFSPSTPLMGTFSNIIQAGRAVVGAGVKVAEDITGVELIDEKEYSEYGEDFVLSVGKGLGVLPRWSKEVPDWFENFVEGL